MACTLSNKCAKNLFKPTVLLQLIIKNVVTCFFGTQCTYFNYCSPLLTFICNLYWSLFLFFLISPFFCRFAVSSYCCHSSQYHTLISPPVKNSAYLLQSLPLLPFLCNLSAHRDFFWLLRLINTLTYLLTYYSSPRTYRFRCLFPITKLYAVSFYCAFIGTHTERQHSHYYSDYQSCTRWASCVKHAIFIRSHKV